MLIACGVRSSARWCECGRAAKYECDWKVRERKSGTCDKPMCETHTKQVAPNKHICAAHQIPYAAWLRRREANAPKQLSLL